MEYGAHGDESKISEEAEIAENIDAPLLGNTGRI